MSKKEVIKINENIRDIMSSVKRLLDKNNNIIYDLQYNNKEAEKILKECYKMKYKYLEKDIVKFLENAFSPSETLTIKEQKKFVIDNYIFDELQAVVNYLNRKENIKYSIEKHETFGRITIKIRSRKNSVLYAQNMIDEIEKIILGTYALDKISIEVEFLK